MDFVTLYRFLLGGAAMAVAWHFATSRRNAQPRINRVLAAAGMAVLGAGIWMGTAYRLLFTGLRGTTTDQAVMLVQVIVVVGATVAVLAGLLLPGTRVPNSALSYGPPARLHKRLTTAYIVAALFSAVAAVAVAWPPGSISGATALLGQHYVCLTRLALIASGGLLVTLFLLAGKRADKVALLLASRYALFVPPFAALTLAVLLYLPVWLHVGYPEVGGRESFRVCAAPFLFAWFLTASVLFIWHGGCWIVLSRAGGTGEDPTLATSRTG